MLQKGLELSDEKVGADILIISSKSEFPKTEFLYTSIPTRRYIHIDDLKFLEDYDEIDKISYQFFTHTLSEGCCSTTEKTRVVGFHQESDYVIKPWLREQNIEHVNSNEVIIGTDIALKVGDQVSLLGKVFTVAGKLNRTGTALDLTIFLDIHEARTLAQNKFSKSVFKEHPVDELVTSVYLKLKSGTKIDALSDNINATQDKVMATSKANSIEHIKLQIDAWRSIVIFLTAMILILASFALFSRYDNMIRSRTKEIGYMRAIGISKFQVIILSALEIFMISMFSSILSATLVILTMPAISSHLKNTFHFPLSDFDLMMMLSVITLSVGISIILSLISALIPTLKINAMQPKDAMNRGEL